MPIYAVTVSRTLPTDAPFCSLLEQERTLLDTVAECIGSE